VKILIIHLGTIAENFIASSIIKGLLKKNHNFNITWVVNSNDDKYILKHNKHIRRIISFDKLKKINEEFDVLINLHPNFDHKKCENITIKYPLGFHFNEENNILYDILYNDQVSKKNIFQIYYKLAGLRWRGEGYDINYYPKNKTKNIIGISVAHANLRNYIIDKLHIAPIKLCNIPYKKNIFKKMNEINKCKKIITDDLTTFHIAMSLRKYVYFLQILPINYKLELFGNGEIHQVPKSIIA